MTTFPAAQSRQPLFIDRALDDRLKSGEDPFSILVRCGQCGSYSFPGRDGKSPQCFCRVEL
jgi:uncharacterized OB-fold protein